MNESDKDDIQKLFEEEIKKPYYRVDYLDDFKLPYDKLDVSVVIVTYNRCPYKQGTLKESYNPLVWGIKSALLQKPPVKEIIIADDKSEDYTEELVKHYQEYASENNLSPIKYIKVKERKGISAIRNVGAKITNGRYIMFTDDDGFLPPYAIFGAVYTLEKLEEKGIKVGAVNLPLYVRTSKPISVCSKKEIGFIDFAKGIQISKKDFFPQEYLEDIPASEKFLNTELHILNPFPITHLNTVSLIKKKVFEEVGGFPEHFLKRMEDREFGFRIIENGYQIFFQPDPKFHFIHGSYGLHTEKSFEGDDWFKKLDKSITLKKAMEICDNPKEDTGARINSQEFIYDYILAFFCLIYNRNKKGAIKWIKRVYREFVEEGKTDLFGNANIPVPGNKEREKIWLSAIKEGLDFIKKNEKEEIKKIDQIIQEIKKEKIKKGENTLKILEGL